MINDNLKNMYKDYPNLKEDSNIMKYVKAGKILKLDSLKNPDTKLINLKSRPGTNSFIKEEEDIFQNFNHKK